MLLPQPVISRRDADASSSSAPSQPGTQAGVCEESAPSQQGEGLLKGSFLYSGTLNVYPLAFDGFGEGGL